jgi:hypothetical protein
MEILRDSSLDELALQFWEREAKKNWNGKDVLANIEAGEDAYKWLKEKHHYKLPSDHNSVVKIARLTREQVGALNMRKDTVDSNNPWAKSRGLVPDPFTQVLSELATMALSRGYFINCQEDDGPLKNYRNWKQKPRPALKEVVTGAERCSIQHVLPDHYEIIDGWGRLLPFEALLQEGYEFHPVEVFLCLPSQCAPVGGGAISSSCPQDSP